MLPVAVPIHHYHYPPTNVWDTPIPKSPGVTEITDLSHLHALFDTPADSPAKLTQEHASGVDVVDFSAAAEALASASADKSSKASSTQSLPTYSERVATKRPTYNPYRSTSYYAAETPNKYYTSSASSPYSSKSYATVDYDSYSTKALSKSTRPSYGPRYLDEADYPAYMAALRQYMKDHHITSLEPTWNRQATSYSQTESSKWPSVEAPPSKAAADYTASQYKGYGWMAYPTPSYNKAYPTHSYDKAYPTHSYDKSYPTLFNDKSYPTHSYDRAYPTHSNGKAYPTHSYDKAYSTHSYGKKEEDKTSATKQYESTDPFDWAQYVASAYKAASDKASSQSSAAARYDTVSQSADNYADTSSTTTTESSPGSPKYEGNTKQESPSTLASVTSTTSKTPTELQASERPATTTLSSGSPRSIKKT